MSSPQTKLESYLIGFVAFIAISLMTVTTGAQEAPIVIAHRGACGYLPEHTLEAASMAHAMHVDFIEQDVVLTKDNVPVVLHDIQLDTVTDVAKKFPDRAREDGRFYAIDFSLAEIKQLSVHERISLKTGQAVFPKRFDVSKSLFRVPTLTDEIELIQGLNAVTNRDVGIYVEIKKPAWHREQGKDISKIVLDALAQHGYKMKKDNAYLQCFDPSETRRIREDLHSELKLVQLIGDNGWNEADTDFDQLRTQAGIAKIAKYADGIGPWMPHILEPVDNAPPKQTNLVLWAHESGMVVHPFTFRKDSLPDYADSFEALMQLFFQQNIDGLFTDFPELAVQFKGKFKPKPKTKAALDAKSLSKWMMTYYQDPKPEQFVEAVRVLSKINKLNDTSPNAKTDVSLMFLGKIIENNPKQVPDWMDALSDLPKQDYSAIKRALWFAGTDPALDWLRNHGESKLADGPRPLLLSNHAAMPMQPYHVDQLWEWYFATGDPAPVYRIAALFSLAYAMPPEDNSKLLSPPVKGSDEGLYQVQQYNFTLLNPALWSCASIATQDDKVLATLIKAKGKQKSDRSKAWIARVIEVAETRRKERLKDSKPAKISELPKATAELSGAWKFTPAYSTVYKDGYIGKLFSDPERQMANLKIDGTQVEFGEGKKLRLVTNFDLPISSTDSGFIPCCLIEESLGFGYPRCWLGKFKLESDVLTLRFPHTCNCSRTGLTFRYNRQPNKPNSESKLQGQSAPLKQSDEPLQAQPKKLVPEKTGEQNAELDAFHSSLKKAEDGDAIAQAIQMHKTILD